MGLTYNGVDALALSLEQLAKLDDRDMWTIISAMAEVVKSYQERTIRRLFKQHTGDLANSIAITRKVDSDGYPYALVGPNQKKHTGAYTGTRGAKGGKRLRKNTKSGRMTSGTNGSYAGTNAEIGFILEYGTPRIKARHWMEIADEEAETALMEAAADAYGGLYMGRLTAF